MRSPLRAIRWSLAPFAAFALVAFAAPAAAQVAQTASAQQATAVSDQRLADYAKLYIEVSRIRDETHAELAAPRNKTTEAQAEIRETLKARVAEVITAGGMTVDEYQRITYVVSTDNERREVFERILTELAAAGEAEEL